MSYRELGLRFELQPCMLCGAKEFVPLAQYDRHLLGLQTVGCAQCGLLQTNPRPTAESLSHFYEKHYREFYQGVKNPSDEYVARHRKGSRLNYTAEYLLKSFALNDRSRLLDYGCGEGSLFVALRQMGFQGELFGIELNEQFGQFAAQRGSATVSAHHTDFRDLDVVILNHVLEHVPDPIGLLIDLRRCLRKGGWLYLDVPDAEQYAHPQDLHIAHIFHFTERTLARVVERAGYRVLSAEKHTPTFHPRSVRLTAAAEGGEPVREDLTSPKTEKLSWQRIEALNKQGWKWVLRKRLSALPLLRVPYRAVRSTLMKIFGHQHS